MILKLKFKLLLYDQNFIDVLFWMKTNDKFNGCRKYILNSSFDDALQTHRRSRAMKKIVKLLTNRSVSKEILVSYLLPITSSFLVDDAYKQATGLQDSAVETLGKICCRLPWQLYLQQLKFYLQLLPKRLDKQKLLVRYGGVIKSISV